MQVSQLLREIDRRRCTYSVLASRLVTGVFRILHGVLLGGLALALGVLDTLHLLVLRLGRHRNVILSRVVWWIQYTRLVRSDGSAIEVIVSGVVCDSEEEAVKVSTRAAHFLSTLTPYGKCNVYHWGNAS